MTALKLTFIASAIYLAAIGLALLLAPVQFGVGAVPPNASSELIALMRLLGGPFLGISVLNGLFRNAGPSPARRSVVVANVVGFGAVALNDIWGVASGEARDAARIFVIVHVLFTLAFIVFGRPWTGAPTPATDASRSQP